MEHYRRKPLPLIDPIRSPAVNDLLETGGDPTHIPSLSTPSSEGLAAAIPDWRQSAETQTLPSLEGLVHQATAILDEESTDPTSLSSLKTPVPLSASPTTAYSVPELEAAMQGFVETLAQVVSHPSAAREEQETTSLDPDASVPLLRSHSPLHPGDVAHLSFQVHNDSHQSAQVRFLCTDMYSCHGERISSQTLTVTPPNLSLAPNTTASILISVQLPDTLAPGDYSGLLIATGLSYLKAVISLDITA